MTTKTTYKIIAPLRSSFVFSIEAEKGLTHNEICNLVSRDDLSGCIPIIDWGVIKDSWNDDWNAAYSLDGRNVHPWDATSIEDEEGNELAKEGN